METKQPGNNTKQNSDKNIAQIKDLGIRLTLPSITQTNILPGAIKQRHLVSSPTQIGDMYYGLDGNSFKNLPVGRTGQVLTVQNGVPVWAYLLTTGVAASKPSSGSFTGQQYFATDTFSLSVWTGTAWKSVTLS